MNNAVIEDKLRLGNDLKNTKNVVSKIEKYFINGYGKQLTPEEASAFLNISYDSLIDLAFKFQIRFHVANGKMFFIKNELARWKMKNPTLLIRARNNIKGRGNSVFK